MADIILDGYAVQVNDRVYDIRFRMGTVRQVDVAKNQFEVEFDQPRLTYTYSSNGKRMESIPRTLFWHDPVAVSPPKVEANWLEMKIIMGHLSDSFGRMRDI